MIIRYLTCDGETVAEEEIVSVEFFEYEDWRYKELVQGMTCTRPDGDDFEVDCRDVYGIKDSN